MLSLTPCPSFVAEPGNILLVAESLSVRVCDFGLSRFVSLSLVSTAGVGTVIYSSPEMLTNALNGKFCDVWSFGVVLWEMAAERLPYSDEERPLGAVILGVVQGQLLLTADQCPHDTPSSLAATMAACLEFAAEARPTFKQVMGMLRE